MSGPRRCSKNGANQSLTRLLIGMLVASAMALGAGACTSTKIALPGIHQAANTAGAGFKSFLGIRFGDSLTDVRRYYPNGINETSPLGFPSYHVTGLSADGITYQDVIYEFDGVNGMQVVVARFAPSSSDAVLERLRRLLGEPSQHTLTADERMDEALWLTSGGEEVRFDRSRRLMSVLGPQGGNLKKDLQLRIESSTATM